MVQAIFYDIDGTLRDPFSGITPASIPRLMERVRQKGILQVVATGRHWQEIVTDHLLDGLTFDAYITLNGQCCWGKEGFCYENPLPAESIRRVVEQLEQTPYPCLFFEKEKMYLNFFDEQAKAALESIGSTLPPILDMHRALEHPVFQLAPFTEEGAPDPSWVMEDVIVTRWAPNCCDITPTNGNKAISIQKLLDFYHLSPQNCIAFGDSDNDVEMLQLVGTGVAMGNASPVAKKAADYITDPLLEDGILHALEHFQIL